MFVYFQYYYPVDTLIYFCCVAIFDKQTSIGFVRKVATAFAIIKNVSLVVIFVLIS